MYSENYHYRLTNCIASVNQLQRQKHSVVRVTFKSTANDPLYCKVLLAKLNPYLLGSDPQSPEPDQIFGVHKYWCFGSCLSSTARVAPDLSPTIVDRQRGRARISRISSDGEWLYFFIRARASARPHTPHRTHARTHATCLATGFRTFRLTTTVLRLCARQRGTYRSTRRSII